jgi:pentatricopeptide repeat protein
VQEMRARGLDPEGPTYAVVMRSCERSGDLKSLFTVYDEATRRGVRPGSDIRSALIAAYITHVRPCATSS